MNPVLLVAVREIKVMLRRPSFYAAVVLAPLIIGGILWALSSFGDELNDDATRDTTAASAKPAGYVDQAGVLATVPPEFGRSLRPFADEAAAAAAVRADAIGSYFVIAPDYRETGRVVRVSRQATMTGSLAPDTRAIEALLRVNLAGDATLAARLARPLDLDLRLVGATESQPAATDAVPGASYALALLLAFSIVNGGGWMVQAIAEEKESRTIELLLTSLRPGQLMLGKLLGLSVVALLQFGFWLAIVRGLFGVGSIAQLDATTTAPATWLWTGVFFVLGFLFYGGLMLALGAVGASMRESGQISGFMTLPMMLPLWFGASIIEHPDGLLALVLSLVPITAPVTLMLRLGQGAVPLWQLLASVGLLGLAILGAVWLAARLFRGTTLLTGVKPTPRAIWSALRANG